MGRHLIRAGIVCLALLLAAGCTTKSKNVFAPKTTAQGSLFIRVVDGAGLVVPGAIVVLKPTARTDTTDALGTVLVEHLDVANYTVLATKSLLGSAKTVLTIKADEVTNVTLQLVAGVFFEPTVQILAPSPFGGYSFVDSLICYGIVVDLEDRASALHLTWRSSVDGVLSTQPARADGAALAKTHPLSIGAHWISLYATDSDGRIGADSVFIHVQSFSPTAFITDPSYPAEFTPGDPILLRATIHDEETPPESLLAQWTSSRDGLLGNSAGDPFSGVTSITVSNLSAGIHIIRLSVTDKHGNVTRDSVTVNNVLPGPIALAQPTVSQSRVRLQWSQSHTSGFDRYEIYRSPTAGITRSGTPIKTVTSQADTVWTDSLPPFAAQLYYRVFLVNDFGYSRGSEERLVPSPGGLVLSSVQVDDAVIHPTQPWIYLNDRGAGKITVIDYQAMSVVRSVTLGGTNGFMDLVDNGYGLELYVPRYDGWVQVLDPNDLHQITSINTGLANASVVGDGRGNVFVSMSPSPWWERPLRSYRRSDGSYIDGNGDFDFTRLRLLQGKQQIIEITMSVSPTDMDYYLLDTAGHIVRHKDDLQHGGTPLDPFIYRVSPALNYLVTSSTGSVYSADSTMTYLGQLPRGSLAFGDFAFSDDGSRIYGGCVNEKLVKIHAFPGLADLGYIQSRGYPEFLFKVGDQLVSLSRTTPANYYYGTYDLGVEVLSIPTAVQGRYRLQNAPRHAPAARRPIAVSVRPAPPGH